MEEKNTFETLYPVDVSAKQEQKNGMTYLSWAWAWAEVKKRYPSARFEYIKNAEGWNYHTDGRTAWVEVAVEIEGLRYEEHLPVMDYRNKSIPLDKVTSFDVNTAQKRCLVKCLGLFGLGLYIYAGEDLPEVAEEAREEDASQKAQKGAKTAKKAKEVKQPIQEMPSDSCTICGSPVSDYAYTDNTGKTTLYSADMIIKKSTAKYGAPICYTCMAKRAQAERKKKEETA